MSSPIFYIKVLKNEQKVVTLKIAVICEGGFDVSRPRDVINALVYGADILYPNGTVGYQSGSVLEKEITDVDIASNDNWINANYQKYYSSAKYISQVNHPWDSNKQKFTEKQNELGTVHSYQDGIKLFESQDYPHCVVEITVTDQEYIKHLPEGLIYSFY